jgi:hypothetical protein
VNQDILLAGVNFCSTLTDQIFDKTNSKVRLILIKSYAGILEHFLLNLQQSLVLRWELLRGNSHSQIQISTVVHRLFSTSLGFILLEKYPEILPLYEDSFQIATRIVL